MAKPGSNSKNSCIVVQSVEEEMACAFTCIHTYIRLRIGKISGTLIRGFNDFLVVKTCTKNQLKTVGPVPIILQLYQEWYNTLVFVSVCLSVCLSVSCVCIYVYVYVHIYVYIYIYIYIHTHTMSHIHTCSLQNVTVTFCRLKAAGECVLALRRTGLSLHQYAQEKLTCKFQVVGDDAVVFL
jgi:hypothetical protein